MQNWDGVTLAVLQDQESGYRCSMFTKVSKYTWIKAMQLRFISIHVDAKLDCNMIHVDADDDALIQTNFTNQLVQIRLHLDSGWGVEILPWLKQILKYIK